MGLIRKFFRDLLVAFLFLRMYYQETFRGIWKKVTYKGKKRMDGKTVLITGGGSGLGKAAALDLARRGAKVIIACLYMDEAQAAKAEIIRESGNENVFAKYLDVSSMEDVRRFANEFLRSENRLDVLINNAGIGGVNGTTKEGLMKVMATNYFGAFLLTHLLADLLKKSQPSRVINISSCTHRTCISNSSKFLEQDDRAGSYGYSKLYLLMFTMELARKLDGTGITVNALHPGGTHTGIFSHLTSVEKFLYSTLLKPALRSPAEGVATYLYLAVDDEVKDVSGKYFIDCKLSGINKIAQCADVRKRIWERTEELIKMRPDEKLDYVLGNKQAVKSS